MSIETEAFGGGDELKEKLRKNFVVKTEIARLDNGKTRRTGKPKRHTVKSITKGINKYFDWCMENDRVPSIQGMMIHLKMRRDQFYDYVNYPEFADTMEQARMIISEWVANDIYRTPGQCAGKIAYAKNLHGWADRLSTENINTTEITTKVVLSVDDARAKIASLAHLIDPKMFEALAGNYVQNQIAHTIEAEVVTS